MRNPKRQAALVVLALFFTFTSLAFARLGEPYRCTIAPQYMESNRDERGLPLAYIKRSIQGTSCAPKDMNGRLLAYEAQHHSMLYANFVLDIVFWYGIVLALSIIFQAIDTPKTKK